jgi:plastocyanin
VFETKSEVMSWVVAILVIAGMGVLVAHGPFHSINKVSAKASFGPITVKMLTDKKTIGNYTPITVTAHPGQVVTWVNLSDAPHTVTAKNGQFDSKNISTGNAKWSFAVPAKPGTYPYICVYHPLMVGTLIVKG